MMTTMTKPAENSKESDLEALRLTAEAMNLSDYQLFLEAYRAWSGEEPDDAQLNAWFGRYLRRGELPSFVRHFTRNYLTSHPQLIATREAEYRKDQRARLLSFMVIATMVVIALVFY
jgi:hypothetical protein